MRTAHAVIGAGYGDEGKGLITDFLVSDADESGLVVRFNGGAQAGHTVTLPDGQRHVFSHFGSGTFADWPTLLSRFFVANPILFLREWHKLQTLGITPRTYLDRRALITTPYDMLINQIAEDARGAGRHGSVGVGFGEAIERGLSPRFGLAASDLTDVTAVRTKLRDIRANWVPARLAQLGVTTVNDTAQALLWSDAIIDNFVRDAIAFLDRVELDDGLSLRTARSLVFEGAQGLLLDQDRGAFPHVTRSNTGLKNVLALARDAAIDTIDVTYATRAYTTRHGAGPLAHEMDELWDGFVDLTNVPHPYQGQLRCGRLDLDILDAAIRADLTDASAMPIEVRPGFALTCLDQIGDTWRWVEDGAHRRGSRGALIRAVSDRIGGPGLVSFGPSRGTIEHLSNEHIRPVVALGRV